MEYEKHSTFFGSDEPPLSSKQNSLSLLLKIEERFDDCWIVIVPADCVEIAPTEWNIIFFLNTAVKDDVFHTDRPHATDRDLWR